LVRSINCEIPSSSVLAVVVVVVVAAAAAVVISLSLMLLLSFSPNYSQVGAGHNLKAFFAVCILSWKEHAYAVRDPCLD
jgi:hypothetical protein